MGPFNKGTKFFERKLSVRPYDTGSLYLHSIPVVYINILYLYSMALRIFMNKDKF